MGLWRPFSFTIIPPWICYLSSVARERGHAIEAIDQYISRQSYEELLEDILARRPDILAATLLTQSATASIKFLEQVRQHLPQMKIVLGNVHATHCSGDLLKRNLADVIVHGEGEETFCEVLDAFENDSSLLEVKGISFLESGEEIRTQQRPLIQDLDSLPLPAWDLFDIRDYQPPLIVARERPVHLVAFSRGCPFRCNFCSDQFGHTYRTRKVSKVVDEMEHFADRFDVRQYIFLDAVFPFAAKVGIEFSEELMSRGLHKRFSWVAQMRIDIVDRPLLESMKKANCARLLFGIESGTDEGLTSINKDISWKEIREKMSLLRRSEISTMGHFMLGLPGETREMSLQTISAACELGFDFVKFPIMVPYPGTALFDRYLKDHSFKDDDWDRFSMYGSNQPYETIWLPADRTKEELLRLQYYGMIRFYLNPKRIFRTIYNQTIRLSDMIIGALLLLFGTTIWRTKKRR